MGQTQQTLFEPRILEGICDYPASFFLLQKIKEKLGVSTVSLYLLIYSLDIYIYIYTHFLFKPKRKEGPMEKIQNYQNMDAPAGI